MTWFTFALEARVRFSRYLMVAAALMLVVSCARPVEVSIRIGEGERPAWEALVADHPLPDGYEAVIEPLGASVAVPGSVPAAAPAHSAPSLTLARSTGVVGHTRSDDRAVVLLDREWLVPVGRVEETGFDATSHAIGLEDDRVIPLARVALPMIGRPVDGLYPDSPYYPLVSELALTLDLPARTRERDRRADLELLSWFERIDPVDPTPPAIVWIGAVGDIMVARGVTELLDRPNGLDVIFGDVLPHLQRLDFLLGNLEGAVTTRGTALDKTFTFRFHPRVLGPLARAGFDYLSVVNNHSLDYGMTGLLDTIDHLAAVPIGTSGVGRTLAEASQPFVADVGTRDATGEAAGVDAAAGRDATVRLSVLSVGAYPVERSGFDGARQTPATAESPGVLWADPRNRVAQAAAFDAMRAAFTEETFNIVMVHGGAEWATAPSASQRDLYRAFVDAGADLVLGHHSHVTQGIEIYAEGLIAYSLGNFVFPGMFVTEYGEESMLLSVGLVDGKVRYIRVLPVAIDHQVLRVDTGRAMLDRFESATRALGSGGR